MARKPRVDFPGAVLHVMSRGTEKRNIFIEPRDRRIFVELLTSVISECGWICHAYCLMSNHYHLLIETPEENLSGGMKSINGIYSQWFNNTHGRVGHLMQGRYTSKLVDRDGYFLWLTRYFARNPVESGFCDHPAEWHWSSYRATAGICTEPSFLRTTFLLKYFSDDLVLARILYRDFIDGVDVATRISPDDLIAPPEEARRLQLSAMFNGIIDSRERDHLIRKAYHEHGFSTREIASFVSLSQAGVNKITRASP